MNQEITLLKKYVPTNKWQTLRKVNISFQRIKFLRYIPFVPVCWFSTYYFVLQFKNDAKEQYKINLNEKENYKRAVCSINMFLNTEFS